MKRNEMIAMAIKNELARRVKGIEEEWTCSTRFDFPMLSVNVSNDRLRIRYNSCVNYIAVNIGSISEFKADGQSMTIYHEDGIFMFPTK